MNDWRKTTVKSGAGIGKSYWTRTVGDNYHAIYEKEVGGKVALFISDQHNVISESIHESAEEAMTTADRFLAGEVAS